ncbi:hypothetical protein ATCC90586_010060 [Pythium insidiosum]|nr:hypothetical protein ATCC90586_010060 [Pythium insidiosum]
MACSTRCPDARSPCVYHATAADCSRFATVANSSTSVVAPSICVVGNGGCAVECLSPLGGAQDETWTLLLTDAGEYRRDLAARQGTPHFWVAKKAASALTTISDLVFPRTVQTMCASNALPIIDKAVDYPVINKNSVITVDTKKNAFLANATGATTLLIENLDLSSLKEIPPLPRLQTLDLGLNPLVSIQPKTLPTTLEDLCLQDCSLSTLPSDILRMPRLKKLDLAGNLFALPPPGSLPLELEQLVWWGLYHKRLPDDVANMTRLRILELGWNDFSDAAALTTLPASLEQLHAINTQLSALPSSFTRLTNLTLLDASINLIQTLPKGICPPSLRHLNLSVNYLTSIESDALPSSLQVVDLAVNWLSTASVGDALASLRKVTHLHLHDNHLDTIPPQIFSLSSLRVLTLHRNPNMTRPQDQQRLTLSDEQRQFLDALDVFAIDASALETRCNFPVALRNTSLLVCRSGDTSIKVEKSKSEKGSGKSGNTSLIIGIGVALGGLLAILIGAIHWKRRHHSAAGGVDEYDKRDSKLGAGTPPAMELFVVEREDGADSSANYVQLQTHGEIDSVSATSTASTVRTTTTKRTTTVSTTTRTTTARHGSSQQTDAFTVHQQTFSANTSNSMSSATASSQLYSIWDDQELLTWRLDFAAIRDEELLSSGMFGEVWRATYLNRHVAVKRQRRNLSGRGGSAVVLSSSVESSGLRSSHEASLVSSYTTSGRSELQQFVHEIKFHAHLEHPKIVAFLGVAWTMASDLQMVLEYMSNGDLRAYLSSIQPKIEPLDGDGVAHYWDAWALQIAIDIAEALVYLHSLAPAAIHRDLKSRNVLLSDRFSAKLCDFGVARVLNDDGSCSPQDDDVKTDHSETMTGGVGTARWAAPEVILGHQRYTTAVDMYSFGVILSELDSRSLPYADQPSLPESALLSLVCNGELRPQFRAVSPPAIAELGERCLAFDPTQRPSAVEAAYVLRQTVSRLQAA